MVVVVAFGVFISGAAVAKFASFQNPRLLKQLYCAIDRCNGNPWVLGNGAGVKGLYIGVIGGPLAGPAQ